MDNLIALYQQRLNLTNATFLRIEHEDAMVATVYKATLPTGTPLILKICSRSNDYLREVYFLQYFAGMLPVPRIIDVVSPEEGIHGAVLMECLPGQLLSIADFTNEQAYEVGTLLARIHLNRVSGYGDLIQPDDLNLNPGFHFSAKFDEGFDECSNHLPLKLLQQSRHYFDTHVNLLASVDGPCMIHRDFRPGNIVVSDGSIQGIIDWSSARAGFAQEDFCPLEIGEWSDNPHHKKLFLAGYQSVRPVPDYRSVMPLLRLSRAFATIGFTVKSGTWDGIHARVYNVNRQILETFFTDLDQ